MPSKILKFDDDVLAILRGMEVRQENGSFVGILTCGQLERDVYLRTNKALEALGGKWNRKVGGHIFADDPRLQLGDVIETGTIEVARDGWFPTPVHIIEDMLYQVQPIGKILEPSAGEGAIAGALVRYGIHTENIQCVEKNEHRVGVLRALGFYVLEMDFLDYEPTVKFDRVYMNPPFENRQDILHVNHAYELLKPSGRLVAIMSEGSFFRDDKLTISFREWLASVGRSIKLPSDTFKESGANIHSRMIVVTKPDHIESIDETQMRLF